MEHQRSILINPVKARSVDESHRAATPLELFYDLIYVVAIASLAAQFHHAISDVHHVWQAIGYFIFIFWAIWWPWNSYTWFASGFDTDDAQFRLASFAQMVGVILIAVSVEKAFKEADYFIMMIGYVTMRVPLILMWLKVAYDDVASRPVALRYAIGTFLVQMGWTLAVLYYQSWTIFIALALTELVVPWVAERAVDKGQNTRHHHHHIEERLGLLMIIVLGESILASVYGMGKVTEHFSLDLLLGVTGSLMIIFSMWWLYFDNQVHHVLHKEENAFLWGYGHLFAYGSATAVGAMLAVNVDVLTDHAKITEHWAIFGLSIALAAYLLSVWFIHDFLLKERQGFKRYEILLFALLVLFFGYVVPSIFWIAATLVSLNVIRVTRRHNEYKLSCECSNPD